MLLALYCEPKMNYSGIKWKTEEQEGLIPRRPTNSRAISGKIHFSLRGVAFPCSSCCSVHEEYIYILFTESPKPCTILSVLYIYLKQHEVSSRIR